MLAKCSNPSCSAAFRYLKGGRLFRLEGDGAVRAGKSSRVEYFWLCGSCSSRMTLHLGEDEAVVTVPLRKPNRDVADGTALISVQKKRGLLLRSISSPFSEHLRDRK